MLRVLKVKDSRASSTPCKVRRPQGRRESLALDDERHIVILERSLSLPLRSTVVSPVRANGINNKTCRAKPVAKRFRGEWIGGDCGEIAPGQLIQSLGQLTARKTIPFHADRRERGPAARLQFRKPVSCPGQGRQERAGKEPSAESRVP